MNDTLKTILGLLDTGKPELQVAAAQILGELRWKEPAVVRSLAGAMRRSPVLGRFCLDALAKLQTEDAASIVARTAVDADPLADHAAQLVGEVGAMAHPFLAAAYQDAVVE